MRRLLLVLAACSSPQRSAPVVASQPQAVSNHTTHSCTQAALGLENATRGVRAPDREVFEELKLACTQANWSAVAVHCFAEMHEGDLGRCAKELIEGQRDKLFDVLSGNQPDQRGIAVAQARLQNLQVGVPECDQFITAVTTILSCEQVPIESRVQLGQETADFWSLPTSRLGAQDLQRMSEVCGASLASLVRQASDVGCP